MYKGLEGYSITMVLLKALIGVYSGLNKLIL